MGCSASVIPPSTIQSILKVDVATNTIDDDSLFDPLLTISLVKHLAEISTQTDDLQVDVKTNQTASSEKLNNTPSNLTRDESQRVLNNQEELQQMINRDECVVGTYNNINPRFNQDREDREELEWVLFGMDANQFSINNQLIFQTASQVTPAMAVDAMEKAADLNTVTKQVWHLLDKARKTGDATHLIRAYTAESNFYKILNRKIARQNLGNASDTDIMEQMQTMMSAAFGQLGQVISSFQTYQATGQMPLQNSNETDWAKLYLQAVFRLIMLPNSALRYEGLTYRGMRLTLEELKCYNKDEIFVCNKAITSTSKLRSIAQGFINSGPRPENMVDVMFTYAIESYSALLAIDVRTLSLMQHEEEVLIMPGILFTIGEIKATSPYSVEIELRSAFKDLANGLFANSLATLFSGWNLNLNLNSTNIDF